MIRKLFIIVLLLFSLGEVFRFDLGGNSFIKPLDVAIFIVVSVWFYSVFRSGGKSILKDSLFVPIILFVVSMLISLALNIKSFPPNQITISFSYIARWILYSGLYFAVKGFSLKFKQKIMYLLLFVGGLFVLFGIFQYFLYPNLRNLYYLGWDEHMHRMFSTFLDPNFAGAFFVLYLFLLLGTLLYLLNNNKVKQAWMIGLMSVFTLTSIFLTYSRSALIMLLVTTITFSILIKKIKWIFGIILISTVFIVISSGSFNVENMNLFRIASTEARIDSAKVAIAIIKNNPFFGVGFNTYRYAQVKYGFRNTVGSSVSHADAGTDNSFLFIFATTGIVGLIFYLSLLWTILRKAYLSYKIHKVNEIQKYISVIALVSMCGVIVDSFFINSLFYSFVVIWMWIMLGLMENK